jgi:hypothetical protein
MSRVPAARDASHPATTDASHERSRGSARDAFDELRNLALDFALGWRLDAEAEAAYHEYTRRQRASRRAASTRD